MSPGLSRREFLSYCGRLAALAALGPAAAPAVADALDAAAARPHVVWSSFAACGGCSINLLESGDPTEAALLLRRISLDYHEMLMAASGSQARGLLADALAARDLIYIVDGAIPTKEPHAMTVGGRSALEIARETAGRAKVVIAAGNCAAYGGIAAAAPDMTGAVGLGAALGSTVVTVPTCPSNAEALLAVLSSVLVTGKVPPIDALGRPLSLYSETIHDSCPRRGHYENGEFLGAWGFGEEATGMCLLHLGCKGPQTKAPCNRLGWNAQKVSCLDVGPCIGCAEKGFWDRFAPLSSPLRFPGPGLAGVSPESVAAVAGTGAGIGMATHLIGEAAAAELPWRESGRAGEGQADDEPEEPQ
jgi:NiFe hydrogenase small subunit HydA